jgi:NIMA (never in mitosis gene a)-related kinase
MEDFEVIKKIGEGSFSLVYKVRRKQDHTLYALKKVKLQRLKDKERENALNEVRILASIKSPFVIGYKEAFIEEKDKSLCIVMEYAEQGDLYQKICQLRKMHLFMEESDVWRIFIQMVKGLKCLHDLKILHRDLKSANIFLFNDGSAKIGDCNVSKVVRKGFGYTQTGTPYYASPEVWSDDPYDSKSDIWSLGCITYEMLNLHPPFRADNMDNLYKKVIHGQYGRINKKYSNDIVEIIISLLRVNPSERPTCDQILKLDTVMERIDFFKDREGFVDDSLDEMDDEQLLKTLKFTKNLLSLSEQLPDPNYYNYKKNRKNEKNKKMYNETKTKISNNISLPNITNYSHTIKDDNKISSESAKKIFGKFDGTNNNLNMDNSICRNESEKNMLMKTENASSHKKLISFRKDLNNDELNTQRLTKVGIKKEGKFFSIKFQSKSPNKKYQFLPNIYKTNSTKKNKNKKK